jgi:hypothetical protein
MYQSIKSKLSPSLDTREKSLTKTTKLLNRIKKLTLESSESLYMELDKLNITMHLDEFNQAMYESVLNSIKLKDVDKWMELFLAVIVTYGYKSCEKLIGNIQQLLAVDSGISVIKKRLAIKLYTDISLISLEQQLSLVKDFNAVIWKFLYSQVSSDIQGLHTLAFFITKYKDSVIMELVLGKEAREKIAQLIKSNDLINKWKSQAKQEVALCEEVLAKDRINKGSGDVENELKLKDAKSGVEKCDANIAVICEYFNIQDRSDRKSEESKEDGKKDKAKDSSSFVLVQEPIDRSMYDNLPVYVDKASTPGVVSTWDDKLWDEKFESLTSAGDSDKLAIEVFGQFKENKSFRKKVYKRIFDVSFIPGANKRRYQMNEYQIRCFACILFNFSALFSNTASDYVNSIGSEIKKTIMSPVPKYQVRDHTELVNRVVTLVTELTKFLVLPSGIVLDILNDLQMDSGKMEICLKILISVGKHLLSIGDTANIIDQMVDKIYGKLLHRKIPEHIEASIEDMYYYLKPSHVASIANKSIKSEIELFIADFLVNIDQYTSSETARVVGKLTQDAETQLCLIREILSFNYPMPVFDSVAALVTKASKDFQFKLVSVLLEEIHQQLLTKDENAPYKIQQMIFLGELAKNNLIDLKVFLDVLYHICGIGDKSSFNCSHADAIKAISVLSKGGLNAIQEEDEDEEGEDGEGEGAAEAATTKTADSLLTLRLVTSGNPFESKYSWLRAKMVVKALLVFLKGRKRKDAALVKFLVFFQRYLLSKEIISGESVPYDILDSLLQVSQELTDFVKVETLKQADEYLVNGKRPEIRKVKSMDAFDQELANLMGVKELPEKLPQGIRNAPKLFKVKVLVRN